MSNSDERCPTPEKMRFATVETAQQRADVRTQLGDNKVYQPYACACGWFHLTTRQGSRNIVRTAKAETPEELVALSPIDFRFIVSCDVKGKLNPTMGGLLRTPEVNSLWCAELKLLWVETLAEREQARDDKHRQDILVFQKYVSMRRTEAATLRQRYGSQIQSTEKPAPERYQTHAIPQSIASLRREAFRKAVYKVCNAHYDEFREAYHKELRTIWPEDRPLMMSVPFKFLKYLWGPGAEELSGSEAAEDSED